jgi:hypothetical protein
MPPLVLPDSAPWSEAAYPVWAMVSGYAGEKRRKRPLVMLQAFIDDSGTGGPLMVMAGFVATAEKWAAFSDEWDAVRKSGKPIAHLKMKEAFAFNGQFNGFTEKERDDKIYDLINVINKYAAYSVGCVIDAKAYEKALANSPAKTLESPYFHACMTMIMHFALGVRKHIGPANPIDFIFDRMQLTQLQEVIQMWSLYKSNPLGPPQLREMLGNHPRMDDGEKVLPLEAAELGAGCLRRVASDVREGIKPDVSKGKFGQAIKTPMNLIRLGAAELQHMQQLRFFSPDGYREESHERKKRLEDFYNLYPHLRTF